MHKHFDIEMSKLSFHKIVKLHIAVIGQIFCIFKTSEKASLKIKQKF